MGIEVYIITLILAIPIYLYFRLILKGLKLGKKKNRKYVAIIPAVILSPLAYYVVISVWIFFSFYYYPTHKFDQDEWQTNIEERYQMSYDVIESEMLIGKSFEEVVHLLGDDYEPGGGDLEYYIGDVPDVGGMDPDVLVIHFENGKVVKVSQRQLYKIKKTINL